jgi:hypothetical protein
LLSISSFKSRYILAARILVFLYLSSRIALSLSHSCLISTASMLSLVIIILCGVCVRSVCVVCVWGVCGVCVCVYMYRVLRALCTCVFLSTCVMCTLYV